MRSKGSRSSRSIVHVLGETLDEDRQRTIEHAALATVASGRPGQALEISVALVSAPEIRALNRTFRAHDEVTDVLSFAMEEGRTLPVPEGGPTYLGDVAICVERAREQAAEYGHSPARELAFLTVHGTLHLLGYDHQTEADRQRMRAAEEAVLTALGLPREG